MDERVEVRFYRTEKEALAKNAAKRGLSIADLIRSQLGDLMYAEAPEAKPKPEPPKSVDLAESIADLTGISVGTAMLKMQLGHVTLEGKAMTEPRIDPRRLKHVEIDGDPLLV